MMAEMPPSSASNPGAYPAGPTMGLPAGRASGGIGFNRRYFTSIGGIATIVAWGCALIAMIAYEATYAGSTYAPLVFHEFSVVTSWVFLTIFVGLAGFNVHTLIGLAEPTMNFIVIGHSAFWGFFVFISSCVVAGHSDLGSGLMASVAFGFFEAFALFGVIGVTVMHVMGKFHAPSFD